MTPIQTILQALATNPVIAAVKGVPGAQAAAASRARVCFVLGGSILTLPRQCAALREAGKLIFVHMDLIDGIGRDEAAVHFAALAWKPDGLISTKAQLLKAAREHGLLCVQRIFMMDSTALRSGARLLAQSKPDFVEVMPGILPEAIEAIARAGKPVIAGGMVTRQAEVTQAMRAGAVAVSTSCQALWNPAED